MIDLTCRPLASVQIILHDTWLQNGYRQTAYRSEWWAMDDVSADAFGLHDYPVGRRAVSVAVCCGLRLPTEDSQTTTAHPPRPQPLSGRLLVLVSVVAWPGIEERMKLSSFMTSG